MNGLRRAAFAALLLCAPLHVAAQGEPAPAAPAPLPADVAGLVGHLVRDERFKDIALSPTGEFFAATAGHEKQTYLVIGTLAGGKILAHLSGGSQAHVSAFWWANDTQVVASMGESFGQLEEPREYGELWVINAAEGARGKLIAGARGAQPRLGNMASARNTDHSRFVFMADPLRNDDENVLVSVVSMYSLGDGYARAELMDITSGRRRIVAQAPVARAEFLVDHAGEVRFATGQNVENDTITYYRKDAKSDWQLVNDQGTSGVWVRPVGFSKDNAVAYVLSSREEGPDAIERLDLATMERTEVLRHSRVDPHRIIFDPATDEPIGATFMDGVPKSQFFDAASPQARTVRSLEAAFPGQSVQLRSATADGNQQLVIVSSDRNPGDFYHLDRAKRSANLWASRADWVMPDQMAEAKPIELKARDGLALHGYLTTPQGREAKGLPMVVLPHGGPHGVRDVWGFDLERQLLAARGYAVLQVNFRGSGGYGGAFERAGYQQWGAAMQDDVTDATRWAIEQGIADPRRVCLYGSSFGGYSALMGVAREPSLYACAAGNVGVYDLDAMYGSGDLQARRWGENYLKLVIGEEDLDARSPARLAANIRVPVFLAAGELDERTPPEQTKAMERALQAAGVPVEAHYYDNEGHGYYLLSNRLDYYTKLLTFLDRHLGAAR